MNYSEIINTLNQATAFDLFRIKSAINVMLEDPEKINIIKRALKVDQEIEYYDPDNNSSIKATIVKLNRTRLLVRHLIDGEQWNIPYYFVNFHRLDTAVVLSKPKEGLSRQEISINDVVGFYDRNQNEKCGRVVKLNQKTASIETTDYQKWRVSYRMLFKVLAPDFEALPR